MSKNITFDKSLGSLIFMKRKELKLTIQDLSDHTGIDIALISKFENNKRLPTKEHLHNISEALKIDKENAEVLHIYDQIIEILNQNPLQAPKVLEKLISRNS